MVKESGILHNLPTEPAPHAGSEGGGWKKGTESGQPLEPGVPLTSAPMPRTQAFELLGYVPAEPHFGKLTYVDYYVRDPISKGKRRMRVKLNHVGGLAERKAYARRTAAEINAKLARGWNPLVAGEASKAWYTMEQVLEQFVKVKERDTNHSSPATYISFTNVFREWCREQGILQKAVSSFSRTHALRFLDHLVEEREVGAVTYNNYILRSSILFIWMIEREYRADNPFKGIKRKRTEEKFRTLITEEERAQCLTWFERYDPPMVMVCMFVFHTLLRPGSELRRIKCGFVELHNGVVNVNGTQSKSKRIRRPAIPDVMLPYLAASPIMQAKPSDFVVGKNLLPGPVRCAKNTTTNRWNKMRDALGWEKDKVLYSLRDTGIVQLIADGLPLTFIMQQADHKNIDTTNKYVQHYFPKGIQEVRTNASSFRPSSFPVANAIP